MLKYFFLWFPMLLLAIANGALRDLVYKKYVGDLTAHQISTVVLILLFAVYIYAALKYFPPISQTQTISIGLLWLTLTLAFEFGFGRMRGAPWSQLLSDYNILKGRLWVLIPLSVALRPYIFYNLQLLKRHSP